jgi:hypothetical protein
MEAYKKQLKHFVDLKMAGNNVIERIFAEHMPVPFQSVLIDDCIETGRDYNDGGAKYNTSYIQGTGLGTLTDCLTAIKYHVFDRKDIDFKELLRACKGNFKGRYEIIRQILINKTPKYGNDDDYADSIARELVEIYFETVDTSGYGEKKTLAKISGKVDLFLYDLKMMDSEKHKLHTGVSNKIIIENLEMLDKLGKQIIIRFPLIPRVNSAEANITSMCELVSGLRNVEGISILPYHELGVDKAKRLGKESRVYARPSGRLLSRSLRLIKSYQLALPLGREP